MRMVACTTIACRLEVLFENEWGSVCSRGFEEKNGPALCKAFGFTKGGAAVMDYGGGQGPVSACTQHLFFHPEIRALKGTKSTAYMPV